VKHISVDNCKSVTISIPARDVSCLCTTSCVRQGTVFQALIVSRLLYDLPSRGCFLTAELSGKIDAFFRRAHRYGLAANILTVSELFDSVAQDFFSAKSNRNHSVLPEKKTSSLALRPRGHQFQLLM